MCHGFLCGSVHINGMSELQNLTPLLQSGLGSQCCPNWLRHHPTPPPPSARHLGEPLPTTVSAAPSQKIEEARDVLNSSISVSTISQGTDSKEEGNTSAQDLDRWAASEARGSGSLNPPSFRDGHGQDKDAFRVAADQRWRHGSIQVSAHCSSQREMQGTATK